jgi:hypothetical protein
MLSERLKYIVNVQRGYLVHPVKFELVFVSYKVCARTTKPKRMQQDKHGLFLFFCFNVLSSFLAHQQPHPPCEPNQPTMKLEFVKGIISALL